MRMKWAASIPDQHGLAVAVWRSPGRRETWGAVSLTLGFREIQVIRRVSAFVSQFLSSWDALFESFFLKIIT